MPLPPHVSFDESPARRPCPACGAQARVLYRVAGIPTHSCVLLEDAAAAQAFPVGDLALAHCPTCGLLFNDAFDPAQVDYAEDYEETQGCSGTFSAWLEGVTRDLIERVGLQGGDVVEVGCGRGDFLALLCRLSGARGVGVDPSATAGRVDRDAGGGLTFLHELYGAEHAALPADLLACRHTLEHLPEVAEVARSFRSNLTNAHVFVEVPDTLRILEEGAFWDVYYEHCSYFTAGSLGRLFRSAGFGLERLDLEYGGQYLQLLAHTSRGTAAPPEDTERITDAVRCFRDTCRATLERWHELLQQASGPVALWGSGSKATGFLTTLGAHDSVAAVVDINPAKHGRYVAGTGHPIVAPEALVELAPAHVVIMNPVYRDEIGAELSRLGVAAEVSAV